MSDTGPGEIMLRLPPLDALTAAALLDLCSRLQAALWRAHGDEVEAYWMASDPEQPVSEHISSDSPRQRR